MRFFIKNFAKKTKLLEIILIILSIYFPLFLFNLGFYLLQNSKNSDSKINDKEKILDARKKGFVPYYYPKSTFNLIEGFYPLGGKPNSDTYFCNEGYGLIKYKSDRFGLRNNDKKWDLIDSNKNRTFFIGDSFVHGACVDNLDTIPERYQNLSDDLTFNFGASGATPVHYEAFIKMFLEPIYTLENSSKSDNIVMIFFFNDNCKTCRPNLDFYEKANDAYYPINFKDKKLNLNSKYSKNINKLIKITELKLNDRKENLNNINIRGLSKFFTLKAIKIKTSRFLYAIGLRRKYNQNDATERAIIALKEFCEGKCNPFIAYIPPVSKSKVHSSERYKKHIKTISKKNKVSYINLDNVIKSSNSSDYAIKGSHLSINGYKKVAESIYKHIKTYKKFY